MKVSKELDRWEKCRVLLPHLKVIASHATEHRTVEDVAIKHAKSGMIYIT